MAKFKLMSIFEIDKMGSGGGESNYQTPRGYNIISYPLNYIDIFYPDILGRRIIRWRVGFVGGALFRRRLISGAVLS